MSNFTILSQKMYIIKHNYEILNTLDKTPCLDYKLNISRAIKTGDVMRNFTYCEYTGVLIGTQIFKIKFKKIFGKWSCRGVNNYQQI